MKACHTLLWGCLGLILAPCFASAQNDYHPAAYTYNEGGTAITSNVPLNEINARAYRHFQRLFPADIDNEYWFVSSQGYQVSFLLRGRHFQAYFDKRGAYRYSLQYYPGKEIPRVPGDLIKAKYPDYQIYVVTEITDGEKTFHLVKIVSPTHVKTLSVVDGKIEELEDLVNGTAVAAESPLAAAPFITQQSYP